MNVPARTLAVLTILGLLLVTPAMAAETAQYYFDQGIVYSDRGQYEKALEAYEQGLAIEPGNAHLWGAKGQTLLILKRYQEAAAAYNRSLQLDPSQEYARNGEQEALDKIGGGANTTSVLTTAGGTPAAGTPWWIAILPIAGAAIALRGRRR